MDVPGSCYALIALTELSQSSADHPLSREEIARRHSLVPATLSRYLSRLGRAGLVRSVPGRGGGHYLALDPGEISLAAIVAAVGYPTDGALSLPACSGPEACERHGTCHLAAQWREIAQRVDGVLRSVTLADLSGSPPGSALPRWVDAAGTAGMPRAPRGDAERREFEARMVATNHREAAGILAGKLARQFCDLLTGVVGSVSLARAQAGSATEVGHTLEWAEAAALVADVLLQQMLTQTSEHPASSGTVPLPRLLTDAVRLVTHGTAVCASLRIDTDLHAISGDGALLRQAVQNLLLNAVEAMPGGGALSVSATNATLEEGAGLAPGDYVRLTIEDSGSGVPAAMEGRLFAPYQSTKPGRSGLGLATAAAVVHRHGGAVTLRPADHLGTAVEVVLPAAGPATPAAPEPRAGHEGKRALVVEDEPIVVTVLSRMLESIGYEADTTATLPDVEARLTQAMWAGRPYEVVVLDAGIAGEADLSDAIARLRRLDPAARLIATSPYLNSERHAGLAPLEFAAVLRKPFTLDDLKQALRPAAAPGLPPASASG